MKILSSPVLMAGIFFVHAFSARAVPVKHNGNLVDNDDPRQCLQCHTEAALPAAKCKTGCPTVLAHPNFTRYPPADRVREFATVEQLGAAGIRLFEGEVSCISCHNLTSPLKFLLVRDTVKGKLCRTCHLRL